MAPHVENFSGHTVKIREGVEEIGGQEYRVEGWWDEITGRSWLRSDGNPAAMNYAIRVATAPLPLDDEVLYGKIGAFGYLVHESEIEEVV